MAMVLDGPISVDIATGVASAAGNTSVGLGNIPPGYVVPYLFISANMY
jgi:hypothetical protein